MFMSQLLTTLPQERNTLIEAYESSKKNEGLSGHDLVVLYQQNFETKAQPVNEKAPVFEKVSLIDPTIRTVLSSTTAVF